MGSFFLIILGVSFIVFIGYCVAADASERRERNEKFRRQQLLLEEKLLAERTKELSRAAGNNTLRNINRLAKPK